MHQWSPSPLAIFGYYFSSDFILAGIVVALLGLATSLAIFVLSNSHRKKTGSLLSAMMISTSLWVFLLSSLVFCVGFTGEYAHSPSDAIFNVARLAVVPTVLVGPVLFYILRNRAMKEVYPFFTFTASAGNSQGTESIQSRVSALFSGLLYHAKLSGITLSVVPGVSNLPVSAALDWNGQKVVAVSAAAMRNLDDEELCAVLAHELGHIVHKDSLRKTVATVYRSAFFFDPVAHFVEAAIYRDGELYADEYSAQLTGKPASLASALIKIYESMQSTGYRIATSQAASLLLDGRKPGIFSKQPSLTVRIKKLLEMRVRENVADGLNSSNGNTRV